MNCGRMCEDWPPRPSYRRCRDELGCLQELRQVLPVSPESVDGAWVYVVQFSGRSNSKTRITVFNPHAESIVLSWRAVVPGREGANTPGFLTLAPGTAETITLRNILETRHGCFSGLVAISSPSPALKVIAVYSSILVFH